MNKLIHEMMKESGKDINEILDMPFAFLMDVVQEKAKPKKEKSLIAAFGG